MVKAVNLLFQFVLGFGYGWVDLSYFLKKTSTFYSIYKGDRTYMEYWLALDRAEKIEDVNRKK